MQWLRIRTVVLLMVALVSIPDEVLADTYYDCRVFDERKLCKQLNQYPAVKDLPVFEAGRVLSLYRDKEDYAEEVFEDRPVVLRGHVVSLSERKGRYVVLLGDSAQSSPPFLQLQLFPFHPLAGEQGRIASRSAADLAEMLKPGQLAVFQCVGDGVSGGMPVFVDCVYWD